jgi:hypothetical protein
MIQIGSACTDNAPFHCKNADSKIITPLGPYCCEEWSDGTASQCVSGYGGSGAACAPATVDCGYYEWYSCALFIPDSPHNYVSDKLDSTATTGYCG